MQEKLLQILLDALEHFNTDGLADKYCSTHFVVNVHGTALSASERERLEWERWIDTFQMFPELSGIKVPGLLLPQREPEVLSSSTEYGSVRTMLSSARRLILIGYSFGEMDDHLAYAAVTYAISHSRIPALVLQPNPDNVAIRLSEDSKSHTVTGLPAYWDSLSEAIITSTQKRRWKTCDHGRLCKKCIAYYYEAFLDTR